MTAAASANLVIEWDHCHGPLGLVNALGPNGKPLVEGRKISAVTDKQVRELGISLTPFHPETELRKLGAEFESTHRFRDPFANHWVVDGNLVTGQNQNAGPMVAQEMMRQVARSPSGSYRPTRRPSDDGARPRCRCPARAIRHPQPAPYIATWAEQAHGRADVGTST